jgi:hypothetical protein
MKKVLLFSVLVCLFLIQGCGHWVKVKYTPLNLTSGGYIKNYTLGERKTVFIGQEIIKVETCSGFQKIIISDSNIVASAKDKLRRYQINHNNKEPIEIAGMVEYDGKSYYATKDLADYRLFGILISDDGSIYKSGLYSHDYEMIYLSDTTVINPDKVRFSDSCIRDKAASYELLFTGKMMYH